MLRSEFSLQFKTCSWFYALNFQCNFKQAFDVTLLTFFAVSQRALDATLWTSLQYTYLSIHPSIHPSIDASIFLSFFKYLYIYINKYILFSKVQSQVVWQGAAMQCIRIIKFNIYIYIYIYPLLKNVSHPQDGHTIMSEDVKAKTCTSGYGYTVLDR